MGCTNNAIAFSTRMYLSPSINPWASETSCSVGVGRVCGWQTTTSLPLGQRGGCSQQKHSLL